MNEKKIIKFNLYMSGILLVLFVAMLVGATVAYFTDTKQATTTFTSGNVKLALSEAAVKPDGAGNLIEDTSKPRIFGEEENTVINNYGSIYPGMSIHKDPTILNTGDVPEWIAAKVTLEEGSGDLRKLIGYPYHDYLDIELLLSGGLLADDDIHVGDWNGIENVCHNDRYAMVQVPRTSEGKYEFYFFMLKPLEEEKSVVIFDKVKFADYWNNDGMQNLEGLKIHVQAFGVQTFEMESCFEAMTRAFPDHFNFN